VKLEELNQTQRDKSISFWVSNLTDGVCLAIKTAVEAELKNSSLELASSVDGSAGSVTTDNSTIKVLAKRKERAKARKQSRPAKKAGA
jgi:hypothetical protein